jgi:hypothetical protein
MEETKSQLNDVINLDDEWENFLNENNDNVEETKEIDLFPPNPNIDIHNIPIPTNTRISTKTKISHLSSTIDIFNIFWNLKIVNYDLQEEGVIKKRMRFKSNTPDELNHVLEQKNNVDPKYYTVENIVKHIEPTNRIEYRDERIYSIGIFTKDITEHNDCTEFFNCFTVILRIIDENNRFKEYHVKVFNTGKLEIPGSHCMETFPQILQRIINILQPYVDKPLTYEHRAFEDMVLTNSGFHCGFNVNLNALCYILKTFYNVPTSYDNTSYQGVKFKMYYNSETNCVQPNDGITNTKTSNSKFKKKNKMNINDFGIYDTTCVVFQTGSCLIIGKYDDNMSSKIREFMLSVLHTHYAVLCYNVNVVFRIKNKKTARRKKTMICITAENNNSTEEMMNS